MIYFSQFRVDLDLKGSEVDFPFFGVSDREDVSYQAIFSGLENIVLNLKHTYVQLHCKRKL